MFFLTDCLDFWKLFRYQQTNANCIISAKILTFYKKATFQINWNRENTIFLYIWSISGQNLSQTQCFMKFILNIICVAIILNLKANLSKKFILQCNVGYFFVKMWKLLCAGFISLLLCAFVCVCVRRVNVCAKTIYFSITFPCGIFLLLMFLRKKSSWITQNPF